MRIKIIVALIKLLDNWLSKLQKKEERPKFTEPMPSGIDKACAEVDKLNWTDTSKLIAQRREKVFSHFGFDKENECINLFNAPSIIARRAMFEAQLAQAIKEEDYELANELMKKIKRG